MSFEFSKTIAKKLIAFLLLSSHIAAAEVLSFTYGTQTPQITCGLLNLCDITLESGEKIQGVEIGDSARWQIDSIFSGQGQNKTAHIIVKPMADSLSTTLLIATSRRLYHISLKSAKAQSMTSVKFKYPYDSNNTVSFPEATAADNIAPAYEGTNIDCDYTMTGDEEIMPRQVFSDGRKTYIKMPHEVRVKRMPGLVITRSNGIFSDVSLSNVNYRIKGTSFEVDCVIDEAKLILGNGSGRMEVLIRHGR